MSLRDDSCVPESVRPTVYREAWSLCSLAVRVFFFIGTWRRGGFDRSLSRPATLRADRESQGIQTYEAFRIFLPIRLVLFKGRQVEAIE